MKKNIWLPLFFLFIIANGLFGIEVKLVERSPLLQKKAILMNIVCFSVTEDEMLIIPDSKEGNIKLYNIHGDLIKVWGRRGHGPNEFLSPFYCDYQKPYYIHLDAMNSKISIYKRIEKTKFVRINEILCLGCMSDIRLLKENVLIGGSKVDRSGKRYSLYYKDFKNKEIHYLLPLYLKYGFKSSNEFDRKYREISPIGTESFFYICKDYIYYVWEGRLRIIQMNLNTKKVKFFGQETKNYTRPKVTKGILQARKERKSIKERKEKQKMSWVRGVFADNEFIGLLYNNYDKASSLWKALLQLYSLEGKLLSEVKLPNAVDFSMEGPSYFYHKENHHLYILSRQLNEKDYLDEYEILKYKIVN